MKSFKSSDRSTSNYEQANVAPEMYSNDALSFEKLLSAEEASGLLGLHPATLLRSARRGEAPCYRLGRRVAFRASELNRWLTGGTYNGEAIRVA